VTVTLHCGDVRNPPLEPGLKYHALLCDAPYEYGFMGKSWDASGVAFQPDTWAALAEHLLPGAFGMTFAGARTHHRIAVAIEDAGFIIHPVIYGWSYGSGFPKATRIDTQIDKAAGASREIVGENPNARPIDGNGSGYSGATSHEKYITAPATPLAQSWQGHRYGLQALKPALEPIIVFQKPYEGRPVDCITETGAGALWVDGGRIPTGDEVISTGFANSKRNGVNNVHEGWERPWQSDGEHYGEKIDTAIEKANTLGRWPANFILDEGAARRLDGVAQNVFLQYNEEKQECALCGKELIEDVNTLAGKRTESKNGNLCTDGFGNKQTAQFQTGTRYIIKTMTRSITVCLTCNLSLKNGTTTIINDLEKTIRQLEGLSTGDVNVAENIGRLVNSQREKLVLITDIARGVREIISVNGGQPIQHIKPNICESGEKGSSRFFFNFQQDAIDDGDPVYYCAKASRRERDAGLEGFPLTGGHLASPEGGGGGWKADAKDNPNLPRRNPHPTIKPIALSRYLATLLLPPAEYAPRRILVPFAGVASEMIGAMLAGWEVVTGIEQSAEYCDIGRARLAHWGGYSLPQPEPVKTERRIRAAQQQPSLFTEAS
jgi:hypothetical protein